MAGHSHSANIKHRKGRVDAQRGKTFSKMAKLVIQAARNGADPVYNAKLRLAIEKAQSYNMPKDKIENAIKKGSGQLEGFEMEDVIYEGYGPCGIALLVEVLTDNRKRTTPEIRHTFDRRNGSLGGPNSVAWKFTTKGLILVEGVELEEDEFVELMIDAGMEDYSIEGKDYELITPVETLEDVKKVLTEKEFSFKSQVTKIPNSRVPLTASEYKKVLGLIDDLDDHDDVQEVYADLEVSDEVIAEVEGE